MTMEIICGDSMKLMEGLKERTQGFSMIFVDPPFFNWSTGRAGDKKPDHNLLSYYVRRLLATNGTVFLCGTQPQLITDWHYWDRWFNFAFELIIYKDQATMAISPKKPLAIHENIWCLYHKEAKTSNLKLDMRMKKGRVHVRTKDVGIRDFSSSEIRSGEIKKWNVDVGYVKSVIECKQIREDTAEYLGHPTQKPEALMEIIIKTSTKEGDWILDPFAGSGTTLLIAQRLNRNCIGIEIDEEYVQVIKKRLKEDWKTTRLEKWTQ